MSTGYVSLMGSYIQTPESTVIDQYMKMMNPSLSLLGGYGNSEFATDQINRSVYDGASGNTVVDTARKYLNYNESNGSYLKFTEGRVEAWCADFVTYVIKESYAKAGKAVPSGFGSASVSGLMSWGQQNGRYVDKSQYKNVKPGDIMIQKSNGASHTGIVTRVDPDGTIHTIEGNTSDMVAERTYPPGSSGYAQITGFVLM